MNYSHILKHARITEKASDAMTGSIYVFDVASSATKRDIARAVQSLYKVKPTKVHVLRVPAKKIRHMRTGMIGTKQSTRKAYVYLKKGETITLS